MAIKNYKEFLAEYVNYNKIKDIALELSEFIPYEKMYVLRNVDSPKIFEVEDGLLIPTENKIYNQDNLIRNYKRYFNNSNIQSSEIIKIEFKHYNWVTIFLGYNKNEKYSVVSYSPDFKVDFDENNYDFIKIINDYLESKNYQVIKNKLSVKKITNSFLNKLTSIFRDISGRNYDKSILPEIKDEFDTFKQENVEEWSFYERWKYKNLGKSVKCVRFMDLPSNYKVELVNGGQKTIKELKINDLFYYPVSGREFSQWSEVDPKEKTSEIKKDLINGILSSGNVGFMSHIPTKKIVFTNKLLMYVFSPNVYEREVVVEHNNSDAYDKNIICKIIP